MKYRTLDTTVRDLCEIIGDHDHKKYVDVMKACVRMLERFNIFHESPYLRSTSLVVSNNYTVQLPSDCVKPVKVGICIDNHIHSFYYNPELCSPKDVPCCTCGGGDVTSEPKVSSVGGEHFSVDSGSCAFCSFPNYYCNSSSGVPYENFTSRPYQTYAGWFNYEMGKDRIVFDPQSNVNPQDEVVLMYKSSMQTQNGAIVVPMEMWLMLEYGIQARYGDVRFKQWNTTKSEMEEQAVVRLYNKLTKEEHEFALYGYKHLGVKR